MKTREKCETCYTRFLCAIAETHLMVCTGPYSDRKEHVNLILEQYHRGELPVDVDELREKALFN